jgi:hypothetical protein
MQQWLYFQGYYRMIYIILSLISLLIYFNLDSKTGGNVRRIRFSGSMYAPNARLLFRLQILTKLSKLL